LHTADAGIRVSIAERQFRLLLSQIRDIPGFEDFLRPTTLEAIADAGSPHPVVYLVSAPAGSYVFIVRPDRSGAPQVTSISVPAVTSTDIAQLVLVTENGELGIVGAQMADPPDPGLLSAALNRLDKIEPLIQSVADVLAADPDHIAVVIPTGLLGLVPLPAVPVAQHAGRILDDVGEIRLAPSAATYAACHKRASQVRSPYLVGVADPDGTLPGTRAELASIRNLFGAVSQSSCAFGAEATRSWVLDHAPAASHLHLGCHGAAATVTSTFGGMLWLGMDSELRAEDLLDGRLANCRLATASACQSGQYSTAETPDEFTGLPAGFLQAGAACGIVSLWQVSDAATALFMTRFYELLNPTLNSAEHRPVAALRYARSWLRGITMKQIADFAKQHPYLAQLPEFNTILTLSASGGDSNTLPYSSPQYWAPFVAWGC